MKLEPIKPIRGYITEESLQDGNPEYIIEMEFKEWVKLHRDFFLQRYNEGKGKHWKTSEMKNVAIGIAGQKAFDMLLSTMKIPRDSNDPLLDQRLQKDYDFLIPAIGKIEVKTIDHYCRKILVKISEWHGNDYLVAWQFNEEQTKIKMIGWLTRKQVEAYPITPKGETKFNPYSDSYIIDTSKLNDSETFIMKLKTKRKTNIKASFPFNSKF
jgi:hypothetical protein